MIGLLGCTATQLDVQPVQVTSNAAPMLAPTPKPTPIISDVTPHADTKPRPVGTAALASPPPSLPPLGNANAPMEEIEVKPLDLTGLWKVNSPKKVSLHVGLFSGVVIDYSGETGDRDICDLRQTGKKLTTKCVRVFRPSEGELDGMEITLRWWVGPATAIFRATAESGVTMTGRLSGGALGVKVTAGVPVTATKLTLPPTPEPHASEATLRHVLDDIGVGSLTIPRYAAELGTRLTKTLPEQHAELVKLGPLQSATYIDRILSRHPFDTTEYSMDVYSVEYAGGSQLCGISIDEHDIVTDVLCH